MVGNHGRIILFDNKGKKRMGFVNKDKTSRRDYNVSRIIEDKLFIEKYKSLVDSRNVQLILQY